MVRDAAAAKPEAYVDGVVRDTLAQLAGVKDPDDLTETADALGPLAAHLAAPWFPMEDESDLLDLLQQRHPELDIRPGIALARHMTTAEQIPASPWPTRRAGRPENLQRGRPDRKRANGAVNVPEGETSEDPRRWRSVPFLKWVRSLLEDSEVGQSQLAVAVAVGSHANYRTGASAFASRETIGREVMLGVRQVSTHISALEKAGWLRDTGRRHGQDGSIEYHLSLPSGRDVRQPAALSSGNPAHSRPEEDFR